MGVHGLWTILGPIARPVKLESLHGRRLAVDASIWIYHFLKAVRDKEGNALPNAHIVGFFRRICKLLFHGIRPVFVFDGDAPLIKKQTIAGRKQQRKGREEDATRTANKLVSLQMQKLAEEEVHGLKTQTGTVEDENVVYYDELTMTAEERERKRKAAASRRFRKLDPYHLPDQEISVRKDDARMMTEDELERYAEEFKSAEDIGLYDTSNIDFSSAEFAALPIAIQYQLLNTARLRSRLRMGYSKEQLDQIFPDRLEFSKFQIARVKERNMLTQKLFNLNGIAEDLSMRIAGEKDKEYVLKKNESGWTLALEDNSMAEPIDLKDDDREDDDEWEDVLLKPVAPVQFPQPSEYEHEKVDTRRGDEPLFNISDDESLDFPLNSPGEHTGFEDGELQAAIALSLESGRSKSEDFVIDVVDDRGDSENEGQEDALTSTMSAPGPFLWDKGDEDLTAIIDSLPKLRHSREQEPVAESISTIQDEQDGKPNVVRFPPSRFSMKNSLLARKRGREEDVTADESKESEPKRVMKQSEPEIVVAVEQLTRNDRAIRAEEVLNKLAPDLLSDLSEDDEKDDDLLSRPQGVLEKASNDTKIDIENIENIYPVERSPIPLIRQKSPLDTATKVVNGGKLYVSEPLMSEESPHGEDHGVSEPIANPSASFIGDSVNLDDREQGNQSEDDDEAIDYEEQEDTELVQNIVHEVEEHARFASEINRSAPINRIDYDAEIRSLKSQQRHDRRDADQVTQVMVQECQELLSRFGIPYVTAPMEAEAQCAELLELGLVDGVITDDSDIFLFGASRVYKNMFNQAKFVECYVSKDIKNELDLDRRGMIDLAHLLGSDYTPGLPGVGPVTASQLVNDFKTDHTLHNFKTWYDNIQKGDTSVDMSTPFRKKFRKKSKKLFLNPRFPDPAVDDAYLHPTVDSDPTEFVWGTPDLDRIRSFLMSTIGWGKERADEVLVPLIKSMNLKKQSLVFGQRGFVR
ncbi:uncharacterized protein V1513DRAFT_482030 [Lipomyces chichibuensis]|uniref:uncharacterized protein n=1 Tax=Lipomyces chichibuensis TaxID=1546026 RepID=UPI0033442883